MSRAGAFLNTAAEGAGYRRAPSADDLEWQLQGRCREQPYLDFQPVLKADINAAKGVCLSCPVMIACRAWALKNHEEFGVWGGLSEAEREKIWGGSSVKRRYRTRSSEIA